MQIKARQINQLLGGYAALDSIMVQADGKMERKFFKISGGTRLKIASNRSRLNKAHAAFEDARKEIIEAHGTGKLAKEHPEKLGPNGDFDRSKLTPEEKAVIEEAEKEIEEALDENVEVNLSPITAHGLRLDVNEIPTDALAVLLEHDLIAGLEDAEQSENAPKEAKK